MNALHFVSREGAFDFLDDYARQRKEEIDRRELGKGQGLIKSYLLETLPTNGDTPMDVAAVLRSTSWRITPIGNADNDISLYHVLDDEGMVGFLEPLSSRHMVLHSTQETSRADKTVRRTVRATAQLDFAWLAGSTFQVVWESLILPQMPERFVKFRFEHRARFEDTLWDERDDEADDDWDTDEPIEERASTLAITERAERIEQFLPRLQEYHPPFKAIKTLLIPAAGMRGGYDFWSWGKVTYRAPSFRDGRSQVLSITRLYEQTTQLIEERLWFQTERNVLRNGGESVTLTGAPVTLVFGQPLSLSTFQNFITTTFERGQGPLRLWGNPIYFGERKMHIYGIDLHLRKRIYLEITPQRMTLVLPQGTCGNTVHRLVTNIQRYLDPTVEVFVAGERYSDLVRDVFLGRVKAGLE